MKLMVCAANIARIQSWQPGIGADTERIREALKRCTCPKCAGRRERERRAKR